MEVDVEQKLRADILEFGRNHDRRMQVALERVWETIGMRADRDRAKPVLMDWWRLAVRAEEAVGQLLYAAAEFDALFAPVAMAKALELAPFVNDYGDGLSAISNFGEVESGRFFRPLFEAAGLADRFVGNWHAARGTDPEPCDDPASEATGSAE